MVEEIRQTDRQGDRQGVNYSLEDTVFLIKAQKISHTKEFTFKSQGLILLLG